MAEVEHEPVNLLTESRQLPNRVGAAHPKTASATNRLA
jgi:hypothetical protein